MAKPKEIEKKWYLINAEDKILGRLATKIAHILKGKHKPSYTPHLDTGDFVVVINAAKIKLTGNKLENKVKYHHSGYPGGIKEESYKNMINKKPEKIISEAVRGMIPHTRLGSAQLKKLKIYAGENHPHKAQKLERLEL